MAFIESENVTTDVNHVNTLGDHVNDICATLFEYLSPLFDKLHWLCGMEARIIERSRTTTVNQVVSVTMLLLVLAILLLSCFTRGKMKYE